jgi:hypothetical protein
MEERGWMTSATFFEGESDQCPLSYSPGAGWLGDTSRAGTVTVGRIGVRHYAMTRGEDDEMQRGLKTRVERVQHQLHQRESLIVPRPGDARSHPCDSIPTGVRETFHWRAGCAKFVW